MSKLVKVVIPAFNEELTIRETILEFHKALPAAHFVIVDNNSSDKTFAIASETLEKNEIPGKIIFEPTQGKGAAIRAAFSREFADVYLMVDADMTYPASRAADLVDLVLYNNFDMVVGDRLSSGDYFLENKRAFHNLGNRLVLQAINVLFRAKITDAMTGYRAFSRRFVATYPVMVKGFELETDLTLHALDKRLSIAQVPIEYKDRPNGSVSKLSTYKDGFRVLKVIFNILRLYKPLFFFSVVSVLFAVLSLLSASPSIVDYLKLGRVEHLPTAVLAVGLAISAVLSLAVAFILDSAAIQQRRLFELKLRDETQKSA
ncbi:MAG: hypothetical protein RLZZ359_279 [Actinomycetota bacterium]|jgi:glycosyltransferase involved in cell wall biosynthesis